MGEREARIFAMLAVLGLGGCASVDAGRGAITIDSVPPGAAVIADGREVGTTPLRVNPDRIFPPHWEGLSYRVQGMLTLRKPGCEPHNMEVNDPILSRDIQVELTCDPNWRPAAGTNTGVSGDNGPPPRGTEGQDPLEARLLRLKRLYDKGLITDQEYERKRAEIVDAL